MNLQNSTKCCDVSLEVGQLFMKKLGTGRLPVISNLAHSDYHTFLYLKKQYVKQIFSIMMIFKSKLNCGFDNS